MRGPESAAAAGPRADRKPDRGRICRALAVSGWMEKSILMSCLIEDDQQELLRDVMKGFEGSKDFVREKDRFRQRYGHSIQKNVPHPHGLHGKGHGKKRSRGDY